MPTMKAIMWNAVLNVLEILKRVGLNSGGIIGRVDYE
jgi:hypothetical protein